MANTSIEKRGSSSLARRGVALVVLIVAAYVLLKIVIGVVTALAGTIVVIAAILGIIWAIRTL
jgi:DMSO reductase anchor subunit